MSVDKRHITVAIADPLDLEALNGIKFATDKVVKPTVATRTEIINAINKHYNITEPLQEVLDEMVSGHLEILTDNIEVLRDVEVEEAIRESGAPPIIRMVNNIIIHAVNNRASDIHVEPRKKIVSIRERVDGLLMEAHQIPKWVQGSVTSRIKIMASMDIAEKRIPQDGRIKITMSSRELDLRVSTLPTQYGEKIVLRILDSNEALLNLEDIGLKKMTTLMSQI
jgi:type IV pilus assembly protein PilB